MRWILLLILTNCSVDEDMRVFQSMALSDIDINSKSFINNRIDRSIALIENSGNSIDVNDYAGATDSETIDNAFAVAVSLGSTVVNITHNTRTNLDVWMLDKAIPIPSNVVLKVDGQKLKLNNNVFDNVIRNVGITYGTVGIAWGNVPGSISQNNDLHIIGSNGASIEGADVLLHPYGDEWGWRQIGVLFGYCDTYSITGFEVIDTHAWAITSEYLCQYGRMNIIEFDQNNKNGDGVNVRHSCSNIVINDITGFTKDDTVATTITLRKREYAMTIDGDASLADGSNVAKAIDDIKFIYVDDIVATSLTHLMIILPSYAGKIYDIYVDNLNGSANAQTLRIYTTNNFTHGNIYNINASNIISTSNAVPLQLSISLKDSNFDGTNGNKPNEKVTGQENVSIINDVNGTIDI